MAARSVKLTPESQKLVLQFIKERLEGFDISSRRTRYDTINKAIQQEEEIQRQKNKNQRLDFYEDVQIGTISPAIDTMHGFFTDLYVSQTPIFPVLSVTKESLDAVGQFNAVMEQEERDFKWARQLTLWFRNAAKYNIAALSCDWHNRLTEMVQPTSVPGGDAALATASISGNKLQAWDMYNTYYDTTVAPPDITTDGEFAAHAEAFSLVKLAMLTKSLQYENGIIMNERLMWSTASSVTGMKYYKEPEITKHKSSEKTTNNWESHFNEAFTGNKKGPSIHNLSGKQGMYEVITFNCRIIPSMFKIKSPLQDMVGIWKFIVVGGQYVVYAEQQNSVHGCLPTVFAMPREEDLKEQTKSNAEILIPLQRLSTQLYDARLAGLARSVNDRLVYMGGVIDQKDIDNNSPISRIRMRPNALHKDVRSAIMQIPFTDTIGNSLLGELSYLDRKGQELTRLNRPQIGQFQKGNKTLGEFNTVMQNSQTELRIMGVLLENQSIVPLKNIILSNVLQYKPSLEVVDSQNSQVVQFNPQTVRKAHLHFKLADGLRTPEDEMDMQLVREFYQYAATNPQFQQRYDMVGITSYIFENSGVNLKQFEVAATAPGTEPVAPNPEQQPQGPA